MEDWNDREKEDNSKESQVLIPIVAVHLQNRSTYHGLGAMTSTTSSSFVVMLSIDRSLARHTRHLRVR